MEYLLDWWGVVTLELKQETVLGGNKWTERKYDKGSYIIHVKQNSGYLFYPTEENYTVRLGCGDDAVCSFPEPGPFKAED